MLTVECGASCSGGTRCGAVVAELIAQGACMSVRVLVKQFDWTDAHTARLQSPQGSGLAEGRTHRTLHQKEGVKREGEASVLTLVQNWQIHSVGLIDISNHSEILIYYLCGGKEHKCKHSGPLSYNCYFRCGRFDIYSFLRRRFNQTLFKAWWCVQ